MDIVIVNSQHLSSPFFHFLSILTLYFFCSNADFVDIQGGYSYSVRIHCIFKDLVKNCCEKKKNTAPSLCNVFWNKVLVCLFEFPQRPSVTLVDQLHCPNIKMIN